MNTFSRFWCVLLALCPSPLLHAQDADSAPATLSATSTADDILAAALAAVSQPDPRVKKQVSESFSVVPHTVLIDAYMRVPTNVTGDNQAKYADMQGMLSGAVSKYMNPTDIGYLLNHDDTSRNKVLHEGALEIIHSHKWQDDPAVTDYLVAELQQAQTTTPDLKGDPTWAFGIFDLIWHNHDPKVAAALATTIDKVTSSENEGDDEVKGTFVTVLANICAANDSPHYALITPCITYLIEHEKKGKGRPIIPTIETAVENHPELIEDANFTSVVIAYLKDPQEFTSPGHTEVSLAYLGDSDGFVKAVGDYFQPPETKQPNEKDAIQSAALGLINSVKYAGPGDKLTALKDHAQDASFRGGHWELTMPGYHQTQDNLPPVSSLPTKPIPVLAPAATATNTTQTAAQPASALAPPPPNAPVACTIITAAPIEAYGADGTMTGVTQAVVGTHYQCLGIVNGQATLQDDTGHRFKIQADAIGQTPK